MKFSQEFYSKSLWALLKEWKKYVGLLVHTPKFLKNSKWYADAKRLGTPGLEVIVKTNLSKGDWYKAMQGLSLLLLISAVADLGLVCVICRCSALWTLLFFSLIMRLCTSVCVLIFCVISINIVIFSIHKCIFPLL